MTLGEKTAVAVMFAALVGCGSAQQSPTTPTTPTTSTNAPAGATSAMVEEGRTLFTGGTCPVCHGSTGKNGPYGPDLTDNVFLQNTGSYDEIISVITTGVPVEKFKSPSSVRDFFMLPKGGMALSDAQLRSLAAYV